LILNSQGSLILFSSSLSCLFLGFFNLLSNPFLEKVHFSTKEKGKNIIAVKSQDNLLLMEIHDYNNVSFGLYVQIHFRKVAERKER